MSLQSAKIEKAQRNLLMGFVILSGLLLVLILYFSLTKTVIEVVLLPEEESATLSVTIQEQRAGTESEVQEPEESNVISGTLLFKTLTKSSVFEGSAAGTLVDDYARGQVTIENHTARSQPLVQTTRLLSTEGVLFRTQETVTVPAGGSVDVEVKADQPGKQGNIAPSRFTIVALWPGIQDQIFATSALAMEGGVQEKKQLTAADFSNAKKQLLAELKTQAFQELSEQHSSNASTTALNEDSLWINVKSEKSDHHIGDEAASFTMTLEVETVGVAFSNDTALDLLKSEITNKLLENTTLVDDSVRLADIEVDSVNADPRRAHLKITATGATIPTLAHPMFDRKELTNKDQQDVRAAFSRFENVRQVNVRFSPFWVFRTPTLEDHIEIELQPQLTKPEKTDTLKGDVTDKN